MLYFITDLYKPPLTLNHNMYVRDASKMAFNIILVRRLKCTLLRSSDFRLPSGL